MPFAPFPPEKMLEHGVGNHEGPVTSLLSEMISKLAVLPKLMLCHSHCRCHRSSLGKLDILTDLLRSATAHNERTFGRRCHSVRSAAQFLRGDVKTLRDLVRITLQPILQPRSQNRVNIRRERTAVLHILDEL